MIFSEKLTFVIFTFNEEARIERVIRNFSGWGRILIVDNYSTDNTQEIATRLGAEVFLNKNKGWVEDEETVARLKARVETPWIYWAFADELLNYETLSVVVEAVESGKYKIVNLARKNYYYGKFCHNAYADRLNRVFHKDALDFTGNTIHHFGRTTVPKNEIVKLDSKKYFVMHFISNNAKQYLATIDRYTDIQAKKNNSCSSLNLAARLAKSFFVQYVINGAHKAGKEGLFLVLQMLYYECILAMKTHELYADLSLPRIEELNNIQRDAVLLGVEKSF